MPEHPFRPHDRRLLFASIAAMLSFPMVLLPAIPGATLAHAASPETAPPEKRPSIAREDGVREAAPESGAAAEGKAETSEPQEPTGDGSPKVAGKTLAQYESDLANDNRVVRLRAARTLVVFGDDAGPVLKRALDHEDTAVRFLAATSLGQLGGQSLDDAEAKLTAMSKPDSPQHEQPLSVRMAVAYALCEAGQQKQHLPVLIEALSFPERGIACYSADLIGRLGPAASAATEALESVHAKNKAGVKGGDYHLGGAAMNALRKIREE